MATSDAPNRLWFEYSGTSEASAKPKVLVIGKDPELLALLDGGLTEGGYLALSALNGPGGLAACSVFKPSIIVLDVLMEGVPSGIDTWKRLRANPATAELPLLLLAVRTAGTDSLPAPEFNTEEFMAGPFGAPEVLARVNTILERSRGTGTGAEESKHRELKIDVGRRDVYAGGAPVDLTGMEFDLLSALAQAQGVVVTRESLLKTARGWTPTAAGRSVDVHMAAIRRKLGKFSDLLETVRGVGYRLRQGP